MRRAAALLILALGLAPAPAAGAVESTIYPGVGIGKVRLGMTKAQVERILGGDAIVDERSTVAGHAYLALGWNFDSWSVGFLLERGHYRAVRVGTTIRTQRTTARIGPGRHWLDVVRAYPAGRCTFLYNQLAGPLGPEYLVAHRGGTQTLFTFRLWPHQNDPFNSKTYEVNEVVVRSAYQPLPEFAASYPHRCADGWQRMSKPEPSK